MTAHKKIAISAALSVCLAATLIVSPHAATAVPTAASAPAATATVAVTRTPSAVKQAAPVVTMTGGPRLQVHVAPEQAGPGAWQFTLERQSGDGWAWDGDYLTKGTKEEVTLPVTAGTYRVVVPAQNGHPAATSKPQAYRPTPVITTGGYGALEVRVGPIRDWQVSLERKTDQGWVTAKGAKTRGTEPMVFSVDDGTYRVRTEANGRFPAYTGPVFDFARHAPPGPISYKRINAMFSNPAAGGKKTRAATTRSSSSNCGAVMSTSPSGLGLATGLINLIPDAGGAIGSAVDSIASNNQDSAEEACLSGQFAAINAQLSYQEGQIAQLQQEIADEQQAFLNYVAANDRQTLATYQNTWLEFVQDLNGCNPGSFTYGFMIDFFNGACGTQYGSGAVQAAATSSNFALQYTWGENNQAGFSSALIAASGTSVDVSKCQNTQMLPVPGKPANCYVGVWGSATEPQGEAFTALLQVQQGLAAVLAASYAQYVNANDNVVPLFDTYNQSLANYYQQAVAATQAAYTTEYLINQLNYYNASMNTPIDSVGLIPGTYYSWGDLKARLSATPTGTQQAQYYNLAQQALTQLYAARMNQLYINTLNFIVTDDPLEGSGQAYPADPFSTTMQKGQALNYAGEVGTLVTSGSQVTPPVAPTPMGMLPPNATSGLQWTDSAVLYQYYGLRDTQTCYTNLLNWNKAKGTAVQGANGAWYPTAYPSQGELTQAVYDAQCPPILTTSDGGAVSAPQVPSGVSPSCAAFAAPANNGTPLGSCYDGNSLAPYYVASGAEPEIGSAVLTNLFLCNAIEPSLDWFQVTTSNSGNAAGLREGDWALTCGNWTAPGGPGWGFPGSTNPTWPGSLPWASVDYPCPKTNPAPPGCQNVFATGQGFWGSFAYGQGVQQFSLNDPLSVPYAAFYSSQNLQVPAYVPPGSVVPVNIGGTGVPINVNILSPACLSLAAVGASLSGCAITFDGVNSPTVNGALFTEADLAVTASQLPFNVNSNNPTGGFMLPITVGVAFGYEATKNGLDFCTPKYCTLAQMWLPSNTSIGDVGYTAPASTVVPGLTDQYNWSQSGYITIADGSCWGVNLGRNSDQNGTISFEQQPLGSACAA